MSRLQTLAPLALLVITSCGGGTGASGQVAELAARINAWATEQEVGAVVVAVRHPDDVLEIFAASRDGDPPPDDALFEVGSLTKTMVAAAALRLAEAGVVDLDVPIGRWLPDFPRADVVTLRHLLAHTSGLRDQPEEGSDAADLGRLFSPATSDELLAAAAGGEVASDPGAEHAYANAGYWVAGAALEVAAGAPLADVLATEVVAPLGLEATFMAWEEDLPGPLVPGEISLGEAAAPLVLGEEPAPGMVTRAWAAGGVVSTAADMARFYEGLFTGLLEPASAAQMTERAAGSPYGLGLEQRSYGGIAAWGHNGAIPGYTASAITQASADGYVVVVLTNRFTVTSAGVMPNTEAFAGELLALLVDER